MARYGIYFSGGSAQFASTVAADQAEVIASRLLLGATVTEVHVVSGLVSLDFDNRVRVPGRVLTVQLQICCEAVIATAADAPDGAAMREGFRRRALAIFAMDRLGAAVESVRMGPRGALALQIAR